MTRTVLATLAVLLLAACGGGGGSTSDDTGSSSGGGGSSGGSLPGGSSVPCQRITGGGSEVSTRDEPPCNNCSVANNRRAADGDLDSFAELTVGQSLPTTGVGVRATAQPGIVFAAGSRPGAFARVPDNSPGYQVTIRTYLAGAVQESAQTESRNNDSSALNYFGLASPATRPFDAVELLFSNQQTLPGDTATLKVLELCSDGGVSVR